MQHIDQEARYQATGLTTAQRDQIIADLRGKKWPQRRIAKAVGVSQPAVHYAFLRLDGVRRQRCKYGMCEVCWDDASVNQDGLCAECRGETKQPPPPPVYENVFDCTLTAQQAIYG